MSATPRFMPVLVYADIEAAWAVIDHPPQDQAYGRREYGARDPEGYRWWFETELA
jgi:uncharacterized glyoxalase superfamily protein PhnB